MYLVSVVGKTVSGSEHLQEEPLFPKEQLSGYLMARKTNPVSSIKIL